MLTYIFKDKDGLLHTMPEIQAHNEIRNKGRWQRQDLVYLGACDDAPVRQAKEGLQARATDTVINSLPQVDTLNKQIKLAQMDKKSTERLELERDVLISSVRANIDRSRTEFISGEIDSINIKILKECQKQLDEAIATLQPDPKILPRNLDRLDGSAGADNYQVFNI